MEAVSSDEHSEAFKDITAMLINTYSFWNELLTPLSSSVLFSFLLFALPIHNGVCAYI
jgi:hypothetical protein